MSHLIDESLFYSPSSFHPFNPHQNSKHQKQTPRFKHTRNSQQPQNQKKLITWQNLKFFTILNNFQSSKSKFIKMIVLKRSRGKNKFHFQTLLQQQYGNKLTIKFKQKRILFGKQLMKQKKQTKIKIYISFETGQIKFSWPEVFLSDPLYTLSSNLNLKKLYQSILTQIIQFFQNYFIPIYQKLLVNIQDKWTFDSEQNQQRDDFEVATNIDSLQDKLYMSTIIDSFQKGKQSYNKIKDKISKQKQNIIQLQSNIQTSFCNIGNELLLYTPYTIGSVKKKLKKLGTFSSEQRSNFEQMLGNDNNKKNTENQYQYIFNLIGVLKIEKKKRFLCSGGSCSVFQTNIIYQQVFSNDSKFWIQHNKNNRNNTKEKSFVIKEARTYHEDKLQHQNEIVKQMKGGYSIYLSKYYKIQNIERQELKYKFQNVLLMDFVKGQTLDKYFQIHKHSLSFWTKIFIFRNILNGLRFINSYSIVHLDLKPNNIIVTNGLLSKIIDFSESYHPKVCRQSRSFYIADFRPGISLPYSCPQILNEKNKLFGQKCDIFSLGVMMFELFLERTLFQRPNQKISSVYKTRKYMDKILISPQQIQDQNLNPLFNIILMLVMRCLQPFPEHRPTLNWVSIILAEVLMCFRAK